MISHARYQSSGPNWLGFHSNRQSRTRQTYAKVAFGDFRMPPAHLLSASFASRKARSSNSQRTPPRALKIRWVRSHTFRYARPGRPNHAFIFLLLTFTEFRRIWVNGRSGVEQTFIEILHGYGVDDDDVIWENTCILLSVKSISVCNSSTFCLNPSCANEGPSAALPQGRTTRCP